MARSLARFRPEDLTQNSTYYHAPSESYFAMAARGGRVYQRRWQKGPGGEPVNMMEKQIDYVIGSGNHVRTYLHRRADGKLVELPLAWYAEGEGTWAMNPGYDRPDHMGFRRRVSEDCLFCHTAYPQGTPGRGPESIDCQRCHGPGSEHVRTARVADIVNPARLPAERQLEVCMQCHLETTSFHLPHSIPRFEKGRFSYRPGEPLGDYVLFFDHAPGSGRDDKFEIAGAAYRLRKSACFVKSAGTLTCTTCHSPHSFRGNPAACAQCHRGGHREGGGPDCISCHMPKRRTEDVVHAAMTDHYIQRKPARDLLATLAERHEDAESAYRGEVVQYYPQGPVDELYLALAQVIQQSNLRAGVARLAASIAKSRPQRGEFYLHLAEAWRNSGVLEKALPLYEEALRRQPESLVTRQRFAEALRQARQPQRAAAVLQPALGTAPGNYELGMAHLDRGRLTEAIAAFRKAAELDPDMPEAFNSLGAAAKSEPALREAIRIQPDFAEAHNNLGGLLMAAGDLAQACLHFDTAIRFRPGLASARYNYGVALARMQRLQEAQEQMEAAVRADPRNPEAHQVLGALLAGKGERERAVEQYREALRLQPAFGRAMVGLAALLADGGDTAAAEALLRKAVNSTDAGARAQAEAMLRRLGR
jgi:tetratricopeptide (TPR) repeat protein